MTGALAVVRGTGENFVHSDSKEFKILHSKFLGNFDQEQVDFGEVSFGSDTAVVDQVVMKSIPMFVSW